MGLGALALYAVVMAVGFFWITGPTSFGIVFLVHGVLSGCYFTGAAALGQMLFPKMKFAQFASAGGIILSISNVIFGPALGLLLDWLGHDYRYTFGMSSLMSLVALVASLVVYRRFMAMGGPQGYVAPE
jgi:MFS family permease